MLHSSAARAFIAAAHKRSLPPKRILMKAGDPPQALYLILEGSVSTVLEDSAGRKLVLGYRSPGDFVGEQSLFPQPKPCDTTVHTRSATLVAAMPVAELRAFVTAHPELALALAAQLAARLREMSQRVANQSFLDVAGRLAHTLLDLSRKPDAIPHPEGTLVRISRMELARHVGCSREMAGRALKQLRQQGRVLDAGQQLLIVRPLEPTGGAARDGKRSAVSLPCTAVG